MRYTLSYINWVDGTTTHFNERYPSFADIQRFVDGYGREYSSFQVIVLAMS